MAHKRHNDDKARLRGRIIRTLVALLFVFAVPLNTFAMNSSGLMAASTMTPTVMSVSMMEKHVENNLVNTCRMMTQCSANLTRPYGFDLAGILLKAKLQFPPKTDRTRVVQPPFHPPII